MTSVTVVIPCFNSGATLGQTVDSVKAQTHKNIEIIVVDDGSTDPVTISTIDCLVGVRIIRQENAGLSAARNVGFAEAVAEYVLPLDADDWLAPDAIASWVAVLESNQEFSFVYSHIQLEGESQGVLKKSYNFFEQLFLNQMPYAILIRRSVWSDVGGYDEGMRRGYEDWEFNIRLGLHGHFGTVVLKPLFHYRVTSGGMLLAKSSKLHGKLWGEIQSKHKNAYRLLNLIKLYQVWSSKPSTYPLWSYFLWLLCHQMLPNKIFQYVFRTLRNHSQSNRISRQAIAGFGEEWTRFNQKKLSTLELESIFQDYFTQFPWSELPDVARAADIGCGSGRWAKLVAPRVGMLTCINASDAALTIARDNLSQFNNVDFRPAITTDLPFQDEELDFAYSLGVLHHVDDIRSSLHEIARTIRPGGYFLMYVYYAFDNRPIWFVSLWHLTNLARKTICLLPSKLRFFVCDLIASFVYWPMAKFACLLDALQLPVKNLPLSYYRKASFYTMRTDALDRFGTVIENRYTKMEVEDMLSEAGFENIGFSDKEPFWCAVCNKPEVIAQSRSFPS